jgi:uncharacterized protein with GYD domain
MPYYLYRGSYTSASIAALLQNPEDRSVHIKSTLAKLNGTLEGFWLAFGEHDFYLIAQLPDPQTAAAFALAAAGGGGVENFQTIPLLTWAEGINALKQATSMGYRAPGATGGTAGKRKA